MIGHDHDRAHDHTGVGPGRLKLALAGTAAVALLELAGGIRSGSLALLSDAAHVTMDVVALAIALLASLHASRPANARQTFGFARLEILAALANGALLLGVTIAIVIEAVKRFAAPVEPQGRLMLVIAAIGLVINLAIGAMLVRGAHGNLNVRAAVLHVAGDALGAVAVIAGGAIILATHAAWVDPALSLFVSAIIVAGVASILRSAGHVLLESAPDHATIPRVRERIRSFEGVVDVHDLHVWTIGSDSHALAAHVVLNDRRISEASAILRRIDTAMRAEFDVTHVTVQFECETCDPEDNIICTQVASR
ncbi:MAG: cation diffusion facilitator family transporter [Candidatus Velthaea sp.]